MCSMCTFLFDLITYTERRWNTNESRVIISDVGQSFAPKSNICVFVSVFGSVWLNSHLHIETREIYQWVNESLQCYLSTDSSFSQKTVRTVTTSSHRAWLVGEISAKSHTPHTHHKKVNLWFLLYHSPLCTWSDKKIIAFPIFSLSFPSKKQNKSVP